MVQPKNVSSPLSWRALLLYSGSLQHDRGMTTVTVQFLQLPGKIKALLEQGGICALSNALEAHYAVINSVNRDGKEWIEVCASFLIPVLELRREQRRARSKSWSNRRPPRVVEAPPSVCAAS